RDETSLPEDLSGDYCEPRDGRALGRQRVEIWRRILAGKPSVRDHRRDGGSGDAASEHAASNTTARDRAPRRTAGRRPRALRRFVPAHGRGRRTAADAAATSGRRLVPWRARAGVEHSAAGWPLGGGAGAAAPAAAGVAAIPVPRHGRLGG